MKIRIFRSENSPDVYAFAENDAKLPPQFAPWRAEGHAAFPGGGSGPAVDRILQAIARDGYFLSHTTTLH
jgi:hypothetical protein